MPILAALALYGGIITGYKVYDSGVVQTYIQKQIDQDKKDFPLDPLVEKIAKENEDVFNKMVYLNK